jgi:hypothetical protein
MRIDPCPDCGEHVNINSDHDLLCPRRQLPVSSGTMLSPDCRDTKHTSCNGNGWDISHDQFADCPCPCHVRAR